MASTAVLPPIKKESMAPGTPNKTSSIGNEPMPPINQTMHRSYSKKGTHEDKVRRRRRALRKQLPLLAKVETYRIQNTFKNNLCLDILQAGYHETFSQIFNLMHQQQLVRLQAGPESVLWTKKLLDAEPEKLTMMKEWLTRAEEVTLDDDYEMVYQCYHELAKYFQTTCSEDKWISDHFFELALDATSRLKDSDGQLMAEAHCNVGLALKEGGLLFEATDHLEMFYQLTAEKPDWLSSTGDTLRAEACRQLSIIYSGTATKFESNPADCANHREYLQKAYDMASEAGDIHLEGLSSYKLGLAYEKNRESEAAIKYLTVYKDACIATNDNKGLGMAYQSLAKSLQTLGKEDDSIKHLEMFAEVSEQSHDDRALSQACSSLGEVFNALGEYDQAVDNFTKAYNISRALNDDSTISVARMLYGIATAHKMTGPYMCHIDQVNQRGGFMGRLMDWKDSRTEDINNLDCASVKYSPSESSDNEADTVTDAQIRAQARESLDKADESDEVEEANPATEDKESKQSEDPNGGQGAQEPSRTTEDNSA